MAIIATHIDCAYYAYVCAFCSCERLILSTTGLVRVGKGHRQHIMSKLQDYADTICAVQGTHGIHVHVHVHVYAIRALVMHVHLQNL